MSTQKQYIYTAEITLRIMVDSPRPLDAGAVDSAVILEAVSHEKGVRVTERGSACTHVQLQSVRTHTVRDEA